MLQPLARKVLPIHGRRRWNVFGLIATMLLCLTASTSAEQQVGANDVAQANNPLANFTAFNVHNYYIPRLTAPDEDANQFWMRYAKPFSLGDTDWIMRASLPINTYPIPPGFGHKTGLGDFNVFAAYLIDTGNPSLAFGIGPQVTMPTATEGELGSEKWSAGFVNTLFNFASPKFQYGYLLSWQVSFAGEKNREDVNVAAFQPFLFYQLGGGTYLRSTGGMVYNIENDNYSVPIGFGIGQVIPTDTAVFNVFIEPQVSVADKGPGWAEWQIFIGLNTQFK
jgi:hypothetical protein